MENAKFHHNISKIMPARPKNHQDMGCEYLITNIAMTNLLKSLFISTVVFILCLNFQKDIEELCEGVSVFDSQMFLTKQKCTTDKTKGKTRNYMYM